MATVGYTNVGASSAQAGTTSGTNNPVGLLITMPVAGAISKISAYVFTSISGTPSGSGPIPCRIYAGTAGALGSLLATTADTTVTGTAAFFDFTFASPFAASATTYWIEFVGLGGNGPGTAVGNINYDSGGAANTSYSKNDAGVPVYSTNQFSLYATYSTQGTLTNITSIANITSIKF